MFGHYIGGLPSSFVLPIAISPFVYTHIRFLRSQWIKQKVNPNYDAYQRQNHRLKVVLIINMYALVIRRASAKLENSFVTANFASARVQLSKLERQRVPPPNCEKKNLFIFPNSPTIHKTSILRNTWYLNNTWTKIQLRSDPVNMQPDKTKCYPQRHLVEAPLRTVGHYHYIWRGTAGFGGWLQGIGMSH